MNKLLVFILGCVLLFGCGQKEEKQNQDTQKNEQAEQSALKSAESWLVYIDDGKYGESWDAAASLFKNALPREKWEELMNNTRSAAGKFLERKVLSKTFKTTLPGAPDGQYVVIQFQTKFEQKEYAIETVTPTMDADSTWRVSGYYIK